MNLIKNNDNQQFYKTLLTLSLPIIFQNFVSSSLNMVDTIMIGSLGESAIAAVGLANQLFFLLILIIFGINNGAAVFIAQFYGNGNYKEIKKTMGIGLILGTIVSFVFYFFGFFFPNQIMKILINNNQNVIDMGVEYLRIVSWSYIFMAISFSFSVASRAIGKTFIPAVVSAVSLVINAILNYILIFGKLGFEPMGVRGAAYGTLIARIIEFVVLIFFIYKENGVLAAKPKELANFSKPFLKKYFNKALPVIMNETFWALGTVFYAIAIAKISSDAIAVFQVSNTIFRFYEVIFIGFASATQVMIGTNIGANNELMAKKYAFMLIKIAQIFCVITIIIMMPLIPVLNSFFNLSPDVYEMANKTLKVFMYFSFFKVFNLMMIVGVLRGGGDTKFAMLLEIGSVWFIGVTMAFLGAVVLKLPVNIVVSMIMLEEVIKFVFGFYRLRSMKWLNNVILGMEQI
ncbi:MATE family efflux transporter [Clostridiaceae bacterium HSG29]|nr:MATE family efflux transporter [Clostridiaceae bacterium HSG29]